MTVITATWQWPEVLVEAIGSVREQTYRDWELVVVGDHCTDDTAQVVAALRDTRIRWHNRAENSGSQSLPNNDGLARANGRYVAYLGHDDVWERSHLQRLVGVLESTGADLAHNVAVGLGPRGSNVADVYGLEPPPAGTPPFVVPSAIAHRRDLVDRIGPWRDHREIHEPPDSEFQHRAWDAGARFAGTGALTVFKFPAALRRDAYRLRRADEQRRCRRRLRRWGRAYVLATAARVLLVRLRGAERGVPDFVEPPPGAAPGWVVEERRRFKGAVG